MIGQTHQRALADVDADRPGQQTLDDALGAQTQRRQEIGQRRRAAGGQADLAALNAGQRRQALALAGARQGDPAVRAGHRHHLTTREGVTKRREGERVGHDQAGLRASRRLPMSRRQCLPSNWIASQAA